MQKFLQLSVILIAVISVAVADVFLKKAASGNSITLALRSPWLAGAVLLYLNQILFFTYAFVAGWQLSLVGSLQTVLYALIVLAAGVFLLDESLTRAQTLGVFLAISGALLINLK